MTRRGVTTMTDHKPDGRPRGELVICEESGKHRHVSVYWAEVAAREAHRTMNRNGVLAVDTYVYRCGSCRGWHLTRAETFAGEPQQLLLRAAPVQLQLWAMENVRGRETDAQGQPEGDGDE